MAAFLVEDGTGLAAATSYASVAELDAWMLEVGLTFTGSPTSTQKEQWLVTATRYIELLFGALFKGNIEFPTTPQRLSFPRINLLDRNGLAVEGVPENLKSYTSGLAYRAATVSLAPDPAQTSSGAIKRQQLGPMSVEYQSGDGGQTPADLYPDFPSIDGLLDEYVSGGGVHGSRVVQR